MASEGIQLGDPPVSASERARAAICLMGGSRSFMPLKATSARGAVASRQLAVAGEDLLPSLKCAYSQKATSQAGQCGTPSQFPFLPISVRFAQLEARLVPPTPYTSRSGLCSPVATAGKRRRGCLSVSHLASRETLQTRCDQLHQ